MNNTPKEQPPDKMAQTSPPSGLLRQNLRNIAARFVQFTDRYKYAPLAYAATAAITVFGLGSASCSATGVLGSKVLLALLLVSLVTFSVVHSVLLYRSRAQAQSLIRPVQSFEIRRELDQILPRVDQEAGAAIERIVLRYENQIREVQDTLSRLRPREIPGKPVTINSGEFIMGNDDGDPDEGPKHRVYVSAFRIDQYPITNGQFAEFISDQANQAWRRDAIYQRYGIPYYLSDWDDDLVPPTWKWDHPVVLVNWFACCAFCNWRSRCDGLEEVYTFISDNEVKADLAKDGWRLPTEAEWEKCARGGHDDLLYPWSGQLTPTLANYGKHYERTTPVGQFPPNDFGVFDILGNVKEWCHDCYSATVYAERVERVAKDPVVNDSGQFRVFRGGSWMDKPEWIRLSRRGRIYAQNMNPDFGFRCVRLP
jgi:formylglycine-generating enzyme required for sulfatase activity